MTSIRAGFGLYYTAYAQIINQYELGNSPFAIFYVSGVPIYLEEPFTGRQGSDPGQRFPYVAPTSGASTDWSIFQPVGGQQSFLRSNVTPYDEQFNVNIQRQLGRSFVATLAYVGTNGRHLIDQVSGNPGIASKCLEIAAAAEAAGPDAQGCGPNGEDTIYNIAGTTYNGTRPYSVTSGRLLDIGRLDFAQVPTIPTSGSSSYNALQASAQKVGGSFQILGSYTYAKALDNMSGFLSSFVNPFDHRLSRGLSSFDMKHNFVASYSYNLPLQRLVGNTNGVAGHLLSGWQISGITRLTTGLPIFLRQSGDLSLCGCQEGGSPNYAGGTIRRFDPRKTGQYFATDQFSSETLGEFGTARHSFFTGPGLNNTDLALQKFTRIKEGVSFEFRAEFFNVFNHAQFYNPGGDFNSSSFGVVTSARDPRIGQIASKISF